MAEKGAKSKGAAKPRIPAETLNRIAQEIAARRRPMTLAELMEFSNEQ
jgi:hypothetical protein